MGTRRRGRTTDELIPFISDPNSQMALAVLATIQKLGDPTSLFLLLDGLDDTRPEVRNGVQRALQELSGVQLPADKLRWKQWIQYPLGYAEVSTAVD